MDEQQATNRHTAALKAWETRRQRALADALTPEEERAAVDKEARLATTEAEAAASAGIYVYTLPHYWHYPFDLETGRTLLKVGRSDRDAIRRFREQTRTTALPEDPILLRVYLTDVDSAPVERQFHELLEAAGHDRSTARTGGREWFLTSLRFLDQIAIALKLDTHYALDDGGHALHPDKFVWHDGDVVIGGEAEAVAARRAINPASAPLGKLAHESQHQDEAEP
jgi:hypothetical protein